MLAPVEVSVPAEPTAPRDRPLRPRLLVGGALVAFWTAFWTALGWGMVVLPLFAIGAGVALVVAARRHGAKLGIGRLVASVRRLVSAGVETGSDLARRVPPVSVRVPKVSVPPVSVRVPKVSVPRPPRMPRVSVRVPRVSVPRPPQVSVRAPKVSLRAPAQAVAARGVAGFQSAGRRVEQALEARAAPRQTTMQDALEAVSEGARQRRAGQPREAAAAYERAAAAFRASGDMRATALALSNLGMSLARAGETDGAIPPLEEAVALLRDSATTTPRARCSLTSAPSTAVPGGAPRRSTTGATPLRGSTTTRPSGPRSSSVCSARADHRGLTPPVRARSGPARTLGGQGSILGRQLAATRRRVAASAWPCSSAPETRSV